MGERTDACKYSQHAGDWTWGIARKMRKDITLIVSKEEKIWLPGVDSRHCGLLVAVFLCKPQWLQALPSANIEDKYLKGIKTNALVFWQGVDLYIWSLVQRKLVPILVLSFKNLNHDLWGGYYFKQKKHRKFLIWQKKGHFSVLQAEIVTLWGDDTWTES